MNRILRKTIWVLVISAMAALSLTANAHAVIPTAPNGVTAIVQSDKLPNSGLGKIILYYKLVFIC